MARLSNPWRLAIIVGSRSIACDSEDIQSRRRARLADPPLPKIRNLLRTWPSPSFLTCAMALSVRQ
jgi:hypothetical protein